MNSEILFSWSTPPAILLQHKRPLKDGKNLFRVKTHSCPLADIVFASIMTSHAQLGYWYFFPSTEKLLNIITFLVCWKGLFNTMNFCPFFPVCDGLFEDHLQWFCSANCEIRQGCKNAVNRCNAASVRCFCSQNLWLLQPAFWQLFWSAV